MAQKIVDIYLNCLIWCKYIFIVIIALLVVYLIYTIISLLLNLRHKIHYKRMRDNQYPCETCLNSESVSNYSPCYICYDKSEYEGREDNE